MVNSPAGLGFSKLASLDATQYQDLKAFKLPRDFRGRSAIAVQLWWIVQATIFRWSPQFMYGWRNFLLRLFGAQVASGVRIRPSATVTYPWKVSIGAQSWIGDDVVLYSLGPIAIQDNVVVSQKSYLCAASHDFSRPTFDIFAKPIVIESGAWVAADVFIAPGITVGRGSVIGARSSVFKDIPPGVVCAGSPTRVLGPRKNVRAL